MSFFFQILNRKLELQAGGLEEEAPGGGGLMKDTIELHYGNCRIQREYKLGCLGLCCLCFNHSLKNRLCLKSPHASNIRENLLRVNQCANVQEIKLQIIM